MKGAWGSHHVVGIANGQSIELIVMYGEMFIYETENKVSPADGELCVIQKPGGMALKKYERKTNRLLSLNPDFPHYEPYDNDVKLVGYYVGKALKV